VELLHKLEKAFEGALIDARVLRESIITMSSLIIASLHLPHLRVAIVLACLSNRETLRNCLLLCLLRALTVTVHRFSFEPGGRQTTIISHVLISLQSTSRIVFTNHTK